MGKLELILAAAGLYMATQILSCDAENHKYLDSKVVGIYRQADHTRDARSKEPDTDALYVLKLQTPKGECIAQIRETHDRPLCAFAIAVEESKKVQIMDYALRRFYEDKVGYLRTDEIRVVRDK